MDKFINAVDLNSKKIVYDGFMITASGILINLFDVDKNLILIEDIAHGLANNCRWNGHTKQFFSVGQHCCMMFDNAPKDRKMTFLMHDSEEAYWGDMIKPLKNIIQKKCPEIIEQMTKTRVLIFEKFGISEESKDSKEMDFELLQWEFENIIKDNNADFWSPEKAKSEFLKRFYSIYKLF
jgi:5'-deoxynucleotidase YfbR-like HD superfamily hydrolase